MREIVGVVNDVRYAGVAMPPEPAFYIARAQSRMTLMTILLRTTIPAAPLAASIRQAVQSIDPEQPVETIAAIDSFVANNTAEQRFYAVATGTFAGVALLLAVTGLFGVVARTVSERQREIAIRMALGADARRLLVMIFRYGLLPVGISLAVGLALSFAVSRLMQRFLFEIAPSDPITFIGAALTVAIVAVAACYVPARRALGIEPMTALKSE
jgi:putative ABC transport system permease protein